MGLKSFGSSLKSKLAKKAAAAPAPPPISPPSPPTPPSGAPQSAAAPKKGFGSKLGGWLKKGGKATWAGIGAAGGYVAGKVKGGGGGSSSGGGSAAGAAPSGTPFVDRIMPTIIALLVVVLCFVLLPQIHSTFWKFILILAGFMLLLAGIYYFARIRAALTVKIGGASAGILIILTLLFLIFWYYAYANNVDPVTFLWFFFAGVVAVTLIIPLLFGFIGGIISAAKYRRFNGKKPMGVSILRIVIITLVILVILFFIMYFFWAQFAKTCAEKEAAVDTQLLFLPKLNWQCVKSMAEAKYGLFGKILFGPIAYASDWWNKQMHIAMGDYYTGEVDKNEKEQLGVYITDLESADPVNYAGEEVIIWARLSAKTLSDKVINISLSCTAISRQKDSPLECTAEPSGLDVASYEEADIDMTVPAGESIKSGSLSVNLTAVFNFDTMSYLKAYFIDKSRLREMRRAEIDPFEQYQIDDTDPVAKFTNGPVMIGMDTTEALLAVETGDDAASQSRPMFGVTIDNQWDGKIKDIRKLQIFTPVSIELQNCSSEFVKIGQQADPTTSIQYNVYELQNSSEIREFTDFKTFKCRMFYISPADLLGTTPIATRYFKATVEYDYELVAEHTIVVKENGEDDENGGTGGGTQAKQSAWFESYEGSLYNFHQKFTGSIFWRITGQGIEKSQTPEGPGTLATFSTSDTDCIKKVNGMYGDIIAKESTAQSVPQSLIYALICLESSGNAKAIRQEPGIGDASVGLMQLLVKSTANKLNCCKNQGGCSESDLYGPALNIKCGTELIKENARTYSTKLDPPVVGSAYNSGGRVNTAAPPGTKCGADSTVECGNEWYLYGWTNAKGSYPDQVAAYFNAYVDFISSMYPAAPAEVSATLGGDGFTVDLKWSKSEDDGGGDNNVAKYFILRSTTEGIFADTDKIGEVARGTFTYQDTSKKYSTTTYYYAIRSVTSDNKWFGQSASQSVTTGDVDTSGPAPVTGLTAIDTPNDNGGSVTLAWTLSVDDEKSTTPSGKNTVVEYLIYRSTDSGYEGDNPGKVLKGVATYIDKTCKNDVAYYYRVKAKDTQGVVAEISPVGPVTPIANPLTAPVLSCEASTEHRAKLSWPAVTGASTYDVYRKDGEGQYTNIKSSITAIETYVSSLTPGQSYTFVAKAKYGERVSELSNECSVTIT